MIKLYDTVAIFEIEERENEEAGTHPKKNMVEERWVPVSGQLIEDRAKGLDERASVDAGQK